MPEVEEAEGTPRHEEEVEEDEDDKDEVFVKDDEVLSLGSVKSSGSVRSNCSICLARMNEQDDGEESSSCEDDDEDYTSGSCSGSCDSRCSFDARACAECAQCDEQVRTRESTKETVHHLRAQVQVQRCSADQLNLLAPGGPQGEGLRRSMASTASLGVYDITINWISESHAGHPSGGLQPTRRFASMAILAPPSPTTAAPPAATPAATAAASTTAVNERLLPAAGQQQPIETAVSLLTVNDVGSPMSTTLKRSGSLRVSGSEKVAGEAPYNRPISPVFV